MSKKERTQKDIEDALKYEKNLQHDDNEEPVTYVTAEDIENSNHEERVSRDKNKDPVTFAGESSDVM